MSATADDTRADGPSLVPVLSGDGSQVLFTSAASNLVRDDTNGTDDVFVRDLRHGITTLVSADASGAGADGPSGSRRAAGVAIAGDATLLVFESLADDLVDTDGNEVGDLFSRSWRPAD